MAFDLAFLFTGKETFFLLLRKKMIQLFRGQVVFR